MLQKKHIPETDAASEQNCQNYLLIVYSFEEILFSILLLFFFPFQT
jgi:hypothetical protein